MKICALVFHIRFLLFKKWPSTFYGCLVTLPKHMSSLIWDNEIYKAWSLCKCIKKVKQKQPRFFICKFLYSLQTLSFPCQCREKKFSDRICAWLNLINGCLLRNSASERRCFIKTIHILSRRIYWQIYFKSNRFQYSKHYKSLQIYSAFQIKWIQIFNIGIRTNQK